jgi:hypothetical protein
MASRDNQGLQIAVMSFALGFVLMAVTTYVGFKQYADQRKENETLQQTNSRLDRANREYQDEANHYKELMGFAAADERQPIDEAFKQDVQKYAANFPEDKQYYRPVLEYLHNELLAITERESEAIDRAQRLKEEWETKEAALLAQLQEYKKELDAVDKDAKKKVVQFQRERDRIQKKEEELARQLDARNKELADSVAQAEEKRKDLLNQIGQLESRIRLLAAEKRELVKGTFDVADGRIATVHHGTGTVSINLGRADGILPRTTFSVYDVEETNALAAPIKAKIEVTRTLGPKLSEARILSDTVRNPVTAGDPIYSPVWHRGRRQSFALAGLIDFDGDGESDNERVRDLISLNGGVIDAQIGEDGQIDGKITVDTRFLIKGEEPKVMPGREQDTAAVKQAFDNYSEMVDQALALGVEQISVHEFLDRMGWQAAERTVPLGSRGDPDDFIPRRQNGVQLYSNESPDKAFRRRLPPPATY